MISGKELKKRIRAWILFTLLAVIMTVSLNFISSNLYPKNEPKEETKITKVPPLSGHWLKTEERVPLQRKQQKTVSSIEMPQAVNQEKSKTVEVYSLPEESRHKSETLRPGQKAFNNKKLANHNVMLFWTDGPKLKALTVTSINKTSKKGGIIAIPLFTKMKHNNSFTTIGDLFKAEGKTKVIEIAEKYLDVTIQSYVLMDQTAFEKISKILGPVELNDEVIPVTEAFEQTRSGQRRDDQEVVRAVAQRIFKPDMLVKLPQMIWILSKEVKTNLGPDEILTIYRLTKNTDTGKMRKVALPGRTYFLDGKKYRDVPDHVWKNILWELTQ